MLDVQHRQLDLQGTPLLSVKYPADDAAVK